MTNVQPEDGTIRIHNILYRNALSRLTCDEFHVWACIVNYAYGWRRKSSTLSIAVIAEITGLSTRQVIRICKNLVYKNVLAAKYSRGLDTEYKVNKNYNTWICSKPRTEVVFSHPDHVKEDFKKERLTSDTQSLVTHSHQCHTVTTTSDTQSHDQCHTVTSQPCDTLLHESHVKDSESQGEPHALLASPLVTAWRDKYYNGGQVKTWEKKSCIEVLVDIQNHFIYPRLPTDVDECSDLINQWVDDRKSSKEPQLVFFLRDLLADMESKGAKK